MSHDCLRRAMLVLVASAATAAAQPNPVPTISKVVKAGHLLDVRTGQWTDNVFIAIAGERIVSVGTTAPASGVPIVDLSGAFVLPGLIDAHVHINDEPQLRGPDYHAASAARFAIIGVKNARKMIDAGFTAGRSLGNNYFSDVAVRDGINQGEIVGPRLQVSGPMVGGTGTHCDYTFLSPEFKYNDEAVADGVDALIGKTRFVFKYGADWVKFCASGGVSGRGTLPDDIHLSFEEMKAVVDEAHRRRKKATAHAHGTEAIKLAIKAGVESIEHGSLLDDEAIQLLKEHRVSLVVDLYNGEWIVAHGAENNFSAGSLARARVLHPFAVASYKKALAAGVNIVFGTDAGTMPHGLTGRQFATYVENGMPALMAIQTATIRAADLLGWSDRIGTVEPGKFADLIGLKVNPLADPKALADVAFVMKGGEVLKGGGRP